MLYLFLSDLLLFAVFSGIGFLASAFTFLKLRRDNFFLNFFLGFSLSAIYFSFIQFFLPLTVWTLLPVILAGLAGAALCVRRAAAARSGMVCALSERKWGLLAVVTVFFIVCYECSKAEGVSLVDTRLYHAMIVSWLNAYKIVPGLANVYGTLGSNSLYLQLAAGLDVGLWDKQMSSVLFSLFYTAFILYTAADIVNAGRAAAKQEKKRGVLPLALFQTVMLFWFITNNILDDPSLYYDKPTLVFIVLTLAELLVQQETDLPESSYAAKTSYEAIFLFCATAFGIKLIGALSVVLVFAYILIRCIRDRRISVPFLFRLGVLPLCILILYFARNLIQVGYLMVPSTMFRFNFPWTVPEPLVASTYSDIYWGTRWNGEGASWWVPAASFKAWFVPWCKRLLRPENWQFIAVAVLSLLLLVRSCIRKQRPAFFFYLITMANLAYWFAMAPNLRFGNGLFYDMLAVAVFFNADLFTAPLGACRNLVRRVQPAGRKLRDCFGNEKLRLGLVFILLALVLLLALPSVQDFLIAFGGRLKGKELSAPHWRKEIHKVMRCCLILSWAITLLPLIIKGRIGKTGKKDSGSSARRSPFALACYAAVVFFACELAVKNRNLLMTVPVKPEVTERRLVNKEQGLYINLSTNNDLCGDAPLPCAPAGWFHAELRLFDKDDMGKGFYMERTEK